MVCKCRNKYFVFIFTYRAANRRLPVLNVTRAASMKQTRQILRLLRFIQHLLRIAQILRLPVYA